MKTFTFVMLSALTCGSVASAQPFQSVPGRSRALPFASVLHNGVDAKAQVGRSGKKLANCCLAAARHKLPCRVCRRARLPRCSPFGCLKPRRCGHAVIKLPMPTCSVPSVTPCSMTKTAQSVVGVCIRLPRATLCPIRGRWCRMTSKAVSRL